MRFVDPGDDVEREERAIYAIVITAMLPVVVGVGLEGSAVDAGGAISLLLVAFALAGLAAGIRAMFRPKLPRARARYTRH